MTHQTAIDFRLLIDSVLRSVLQEVVRCLPGMQRCMPQADSRSKADEGLRLVNASPEHTFQARRITGGQKTNKRKQLFGLSRERGGGQICLCVAFSRADTKFQEISGKCRDSSGTIPG